MDKRTRRIKMRASESSPIGKSKSFKKDYYILWDVVFAAQDPYKSTIKEMDKAIKKLKKLWRKTK